MHVPHHSNGIRIRKADQPGGFNEMLISESAPDVWDGMTEDQIHRSVLAPLSLAYA